MLTMTPAIRSLIRPDTDLSKIREQAVKAGNGAASYCGRAQGLLRTDLNRGNLSSCRTGRFGVNPNHHGIQIHYLTGVGDDQIPYSFFLNLFALARIRLFPRQGPLACKVARPSSADFVHGSYGFCSDRDSIARKGRPLRTGAGKRSLGYSWLGFLFYSFWGFLLIGAARNALQAGKPYRRVFSAHFHRFDRSRLRPCRSVCHKHLRVF